MKCKFESLFLVLFGLQVSAQVEPKTVNLGEISVKPKTDFSTYFDFQNQSTGNVINDGSMYFYGDYDNAGLFSYTTNATTGYVVFEGKNKTIQTISGASPSDFYDVLFNKQASDYAFHLTNDIQNAGVVNFSNGIVYNDKAAGGAFVFLKGATHINTADGSHVRGEVKKVGDEAFKYPIGKSQYYRFAAISAPSTISEQITGEYMLENSNASYPHADKQTTIGLIDNNEYWLINNATSSEQSLVVTLSYDSRTTPAALLSDVTKLRVVRWDETEKKWMDEGGVVDEANKTVSTVSTVNKFGVFTLALVTDAVTPVEDVVIYNGVTPNGDGLNDYFVIENIENFPENNVSIYNRWGRKVYETNSYNSSGNVFKGYAEGVSVVNKGEKLPTGTYYYIVEYKDTRNGNNQVIKKVGYLHLEQNN